MKYYRFGFNDDLREVGKQPQSTEIKSIEYNSEDLGFDGPIDVPLIPPQPIIQAKARPTTFLNVVAVNFCKYLVCKDDFVSFLEKFNIGKFNYWPIKIYHKNKLLNNYYLLHLSYPSQSEIINFKASKFTIGSLTDWKYNGGSITISDYQNYLSTEEMLAIDGMQINSTKVILDLSKSEFDLFRLAHIPRVTGYYFSERLKKAIDERQFTGIDFIDIKDYFKGVESSPPS